MLLPNPDGSDRSDNQEVTGKGELRSLFSVLIAFLGGVTALISFPMLLTLPMLFDNPRAESDWLTWMVFFGMLATPFVSAFSAILSMRPWAFDQRVGACLFGGLILYMSILTAIGALRSS